MANLTKLKRSDKNITQMLRECYKEKEHVTKKLDRINKKIGRLEYSKVNCKISIKEERKKQTRSLRK